MTHSETLFEQAQKYIPGGVNSPVRAFRSVGAPRSFLNMLKALIFTTRMASAISITLDPGAR